MRRLASRLAVRGATARFCAMKPPTAGSAAAGAIGEDVVAWFSRVWRLAPTDADAAAVPVDRLMQALAVCHGGVIPIALTQGLWAAYDTQATPAGPVLGAALEAALSAESAAPLAFAASLAGLGIDRATVARDAAAVAAAAGGETTTDGRLRSQCAALREALTPAYERWFRQSLSMADGTRRLIYLRLALLNATAELKTLAARSPENAAAAKAAEATVGPVLDSLTAVLRKWCGTAWLALEELRWDRTPAVVFEHVRRTEAVHRFADLEAVKRRAAPTTGRSLYGFFHPTVVGEPLAMVQVAFTRGIAPNVDRILSNAAPEAAGDPADPRRAAIFYSITATQPGLKGIELGNLLIKSVAADVQRRHPEVELFSTLSPIPGYVPWLRGAAAKPQDPTPEVAAAVAPPCAALLATFGLASAHDAAAIAAAHPAGIARALEEGLAAYLPHHHDGTLAQRLVAMLCAHSRPEGLWFQDDAAVALLQPLLERSVARYLHQVKRRGRAFDPVANFHLRNGAVLHRVNAGGNRNVRGSASSGCVMVNYRYDLDTVDGNAQRYAQSGDIATGAPFDALGPGLV